MTYQKFYKWGKSVFATIPGLAIIAFNLGVPPGMSRLMLGAVIEVCGIITISIFHLKRVQFKRIPILKLQRKTISCLIIFLVALITYLFIYKQQVIYNSNYDESMLIPIEYNSQLKFMIDKAGGISNAINYYGPAALQKEIDNSPTEIAITEMLFFLNYILIFEMLTLSFAWSAAKSVQ